MPITSRIYVFEFLYASKIHWNSKREMVILKSFDSSIPIEKWAKDKNQYMCGYTHTICLHIQ